MGGQARGARPSIPRYKVAPVRTATIDVPAAAIEDLRARLASTRWFDWAEGSGWAYGTDIDYLRGLCAYWERGFDWAAVQERLNSFDQVETFVDGAKPQLEASVANIRTFSEGLGAVEPEKVKQIIDNAVTFSDALARNSGAPLPGGGSNARERGFVRIEMDADQQRRCVISLHDMRLAHGRQGLYLGR